MKPVRVKRQKVTAACNPCRSRKIKCDGRQPLCDPCQRRGARGPACSWDASQRHVSVAAQISSLRNQIRNLEEQNEDQNIQPDASGSNIPPSLLAPSDIPIVIRNVQQNSNLGNTHAATVSADDDMWRPLSKPSKRTTSASQNDTFLAILGPARDDDHRNGFFGSSSAGTFAKRVRQIVEHQLTPTPISVFEPNDNYQPGTESRQRNLRRKPAIDYDLPTRQRADMLLEIYWKYSHVVFPILDQQQVQEQYEALWNADTSVSEEPSFLCLLNVIFALSSKMSTATPLDDRESRASIYHQRARDLMDFLELGSVTLIQACLLLAQYFQTTEAPQPGWVLIGVAVRTAQSIGIHLPQTSNSTCDRRRQEVLRRVWHGCIYMDRVFSMTSGRPCMINREMASDVPLPQPLSFEGLPAGPYTPSSPSTAQPTLVDFYIYSLKLYEIVYDVLVCYNAAAKADNISSGEEPYEKYFGHLLTPLSATFLEFEQRLWRWKNSLPKHLWIGTRPERDGFEAILYRQAVTLRQRFLYIRLLLLRPLLSTFITADFQHASETGSSDDSLARRIAFQCALTCVEVAREAIQTNYVEKMILPGEIGFLSAWWYNVLFLYASGTVLIAARLNDAILCEVSEDSILDSWRKASELLGNYARYSKSIRRCFRMLQILFETVPYRYSRLRQKTSKDGGDSSQSNLEPDQQTAPENLSMQQMSTSTFGVAQSNDETSLPFEEMDLDMTRAWLENEPFVPDDLSWFTYAPFDSLEGLSMF